MIIIAASFSLLVIVAGMFLLAKSQKDNLSNFFKYVAYFVIVVGALNLFVGTTCMLVRGVMNHVRSEFRSHEGNGGNSNHMGMCKMHMNCSQKEGCESEERGCAFGGGGMQMEKCIKVEMNGDGEKEECEEGMKGGKDCCKKMKKDSVVIIKK